MGSEENFPQGHEGGIQKRVCLTPKPKATWPELSCLLSLLLFPASCQAGSSTSELRRWSRRTGFLLGWRLTVWGRSELRKGDLMLNWLLNWDCVHNVKWPLMFAWEEQEFRGPLSAEGDYTHWKWWYLSQIALAHHPGDSFCYQNVSLTRIERCALLHNAIFSANIMRGK